MWFCERAIPNFCKNMQSYVTNRDRARNRGVYGVEISSVLRGLIRGVEDRMQGFGVAGSRLLVTQQNSIGTKHEQLAFRSPR